DVRAADAPARPGRRGAAAGGDGTRRRLRSRGQLLRERRRGERDPPQLRQRGRGRHRARDRRAGRGGPGGGVSAGTCASVLDAIGATPLVALDRLACGLPGRVLAKLESLNPGGSVKDRIARRKIDAAERDGRLKPGGTVVELT